jgi:hypothetical protein
MGFRGPNRGIDTAAITAPYRLRREEEETAFENAMRRAEQGNRASQILGQSIERDESRRAGEEAGRARLAMTPGVREGGGGSRWGMTVADSPALRPRSFRQFGRDYSFDPVAAGEQEGAARGVMQNTEESTRMDALKRIPGLSPRMASRMVYGRTGVMDEEDPSVLRTALSEYLRAPSREAAAKAIEAGANANTFPDRFFLPESDQPPRRGTPEYMAMRRAELMQDAEIDTEFLREQAPIRARATAAARPPVRSKGIIKQLASGEFIRIDPETGDIEGLGAMGAKPGARGSMLDDLLAPPAVAPATPTAVPAAPTVAPESTATSMVPDEAERQAFTAAYRALRKRGVKDPTAAQVRAEMAALAGGGRGRPE